MPIIVAAEIDHFAARLPRKIMVTNEHLKVGGESIVADNLQEFFRFCEIMGHQRRRPHVKWGAFLQAEYLSEVPRFRCDLSLRRQVRWKKVFQRLNGYTR
jgi:hypothetical protein